jgi:hypothetical protein
MVAGISGNKRNRVKYPPATRDGAIGGPGGRRSRGAVYRPSHLVGGSQARGKARWLRLFVTRVSPLRYNRIYRLN